MLQLQNKLRELEGVNSLELSDILCKEAQKYAKFMGRRLWLSSYNWEERRKKLIALYGFTDLHEIVGLGDNEDPIIRQLYNQPDNRKIVLKNWKWLGYGSFRARNEITYWCILYGE